MTSNADTARPTSKYARLPVAIWAAICISIAMVIALSAYEYAALGWHPAREEPALFTAYHWLRMAVSTALAAALCMTLATFGDAGRAPSARAPDLQIGGLSLVAGCAVIALLIVDRALFHAMAGEDLALEWASALLLFAGGFLFLAAALRRRRIANGAALDLLILIGFGGLFLLIAMEEISWGQRVIGFETPGAMAEINWQSEFNFHNLQTDLSELGYYLGTGILLIALPLVKETLPHWWPVRRFGAFMPDRTVALISAPMLFLSYGHWNLLPIQFLAIFGALTMAVFARSARLRGDGAEAALFAVMSAVILAGQIAVLLLGPSMVEIFDATEYREFFIALGLACFAWQFFRDRRFDAQAAPA